MHHTPSESAYLATFVLSKNVQNLFLINYDYFEFLFFKKKCFCGHSVVLDNVTLYRPFDL